MALEVIMTRGLPASGKSTWSKAQVATHPDRYKRITKDTLRGMLAAGYSKAREAFVCDARNALIGAALTAGYTPIVDDTNFAPQHERDIRAYLDAHGWERVPIRIQDFTDVPIEECIRRDQGRANYVGEQVIRRMWRQYLAPAIVAPPYVPNAPTAIICDLDGTLALMCDRSPYDESRCDEDALNEPVAHIVRLAWLNGDTVIFVSGRHERGREPTLRFLRTHQLPTDHLYMRADGDDRPDDVVKRELYDAHIAGKVNVRFVLDDRARVVRLWRSLGLVCLQVADGDF